jgi:hypothetical protein
MLRFSLESWSSCLRMYSQSFLASSVRGSGSLPTAAFFGVGIGQLECAGLDSQAKDFGDRASHVGKQVFPDSATARVLERCKAAVTCWIFREQAASSSRFMSRNPKQNLLIPHLRENRFITSGRETWLRAAFSGILVSLGRTWASSGERLSRLPKATRRPRNQGRSRLYLGCWNTGKSSVRLSSKFVSQVLLCLSEIELVDEIIFASSALLELADQKRV